MAAWNELIWCACVLNHNWNKAHQLSRALLNIHSVFCSVLLKKVLWVLSPVCGAFSNLTVSQNDIGNFLCNFSIHCFGSSHFPFSVNLWTQSSILRKWIWCFLANPLHSLICRGPSELSPSWINISMSSSSLSISSNHPYHLLTSLSLFFSFFFLSICLDVSGKSSLKGAAKSLGYGDGSCFYFQP